MINPPTTDRRDVAHTTNPIGGHGNIEKDAKSNLSEPALSAGLAKKGVKPTEQDKDNSRRMDPTPSKIAR